MGDKEKRPITLPHLTGSKVFLRPASVEDVANTYHWYVLSDPHTILPEAYIFKSAKEAAEEFGNRQKAGEAERFMIVPNKEKNPVGWIGFHSLNSHNRSAALEIMIDPDERHDGHAIAALEIIGHYLFTMRGLNRLSILVAESNIAGVALLERAGFKRDGTLRREFFIQGEYIDGIIFSMLNHEAPW